MGGSSYIPSWSREQHNSSLGSYNLYDSRSSRKQISKETKTEKPTDNIEDNKEISKLKDTINSQSRKINELNGTIEDQKATINSQSREIKELNGTIEEQKVTINNQSNEINQLNSTIKKQKDTIYQLEEYKKAIENKKLEKRELLRKYRDIVRNTTQSTFGAKNAEGEKVLKVLEQMIDFLSQFNEKHREILNKPYTEMKDSYSRMRENELNKIYGKDEIKQGPFDSELGILNKFFDLTFMIDQLLKYHNIETEFGKEDEKQINIVISEEKQDKLTILERIKRFLKRSFGNSDGNDDIGQSMSQENRKHLIEELRKGNIEALEGKEIVIRDSGKKEISRESVDGENEL